MKDTVLWREWDIQVVSTHSNGLSITRITVFVLALLKFTYELIFHRPDIVHIHTAAYGSFVRKGILTWLSKLFCVPVVLHMHAADFHTFFDDATKPVRFFIRTTLERADALVALGDAWAERLRRYAPNAEIVVVPNAIRPGKSVNHDVNDGRVRAIFVGEIGERKGTFTLIDAWATVRAEVLGASRARLTIVGDGEVERAKRQVERLGLNDCVEVHGWMERAAVEQLMSISHILILPSRDEGQPMAVLEAMARGICVVATEVGGIPELLKDDCGVLVQPDQVEPLAKAIGYVIENSQVRAAIGSRALQRIREHFDVDVVSRRFDELYGVLAFAEEP